MEHLKAHDVPEAEGQYRRALEIDPKFATVWARLGAVYDNVGQFTKSADCFKKAFDLSKNVSEREKFTIDGFYYGNVTGDLQKMVDTLTLAVQTYPNDQNYWIDLGIAQGNIGQLEQALASHQKSLALNPDSAIPHVNVLNCLIELDRFAEAETFAAQVQKLGMNDTGDLTNLYWLHAFTGKTAAMAQDAAAIKGRPDENNLSFTIALLQEYRGQYAAAEKTWRLCEQQCIEQKAGDAEAFARLNLVSGRLVAELPVDAEAEIKSSLALDALNGLEAYDLVCPGPYIRGRAYLELKDGPNAVAAFREATKYRGAAVGNYCQDYGQAQLGLARAYMLMGDKISARKSYEALFAIWREADPTLPQLVAATKEYAALN